MGTRGNGGSGEKDEQPGEEMAMVASEVGGKEGLKGRSSAKNVWETQRVQCGMGRGKSATGHNKSVVIHTIVQQDSVTTANNHITRLFS